MKATGRKAPKSTTNSSILPEISMLITKLKKPHAQDIDHEIRTLSENFEEALKSSSFFKIPIETFGEILKSVNMFKIKDHFKFLQTVFTKVNKHYKDQSILILNYINQDALDLSIDQLISLLTLFKSNNYFLKISEKYENEKTNQEEEESVSSHGFRTKQTRNRSSFQRTPSTT